MMQVKLPRNVIGQELADAIEDSARQIGGWGVIIKKEKRYVSNPTRECETHRTIYFGQSLSIALDRIFGSFPIGLSGVFRAYIDTEKEYRKSETLAIQSTEGDGIFRRRASKLRTFVDGLYERLQSPQAVVAGSI